MISLAVLEVRLEPDFGCSSQLPRSAARSFRYFQQVPVNEFVDPVDFHSFPPFSEGSKYLEVFPASFHLAIRNGSPTWPGWLLDGRPLPEGLPPKPKELAFFFGGFPPGYHVSFSQIRAIDGKKWTSTIRNRGFFPCPSVKSRLQLRSWKRLRRQNRDA